MLNFQQENKVVYTEKHKKRKSGKRAEKGEKAEEVATLIITVTDYPYYTRKKNRLTRANGTFSYTQTSYIY